MMMRLSRLGRSERGVGAVEFALAAPVFLGMLIGIIQLGRLYLANSGLNHAVEEAARVAAVYPAPADDTGVRARLEAARWGLQGTLTPSIVRGTAADGMPVMDISLDYTAPIDFVFFKTSPVTLNHTRRVYLQVEDTGSGSDDETETPAPTPTTPTTPPTGGSTSSPGNSGNAARGNGNGGNKHDN
jgi:Flp pilus assembly protein TadG